MLILAVTCADEGSCLAQIIDHLLMQSGPLHSPEHCSAVDVICHFGQYASLECLSLHLKMLDQVSVSFTPFVPSSGRGVTLA